MLSIWGEEKEMQLFRTQNTDLMVIFINLIKEI